LTESVFRALPSMRVRIRRQQDTGATSLCLLADDFPI
jgi:hypothetical protein